MDWRRDGADWPNRAHSRFVTTRAHHWHVQRAGAGPRILLLHGAGAATHSWRHLLPLLAARAEVLAPDLPGHGFTRRRGLARAKLPEMAADLGDLLAAEAFAPDLIVGHSAGAATALRLVLDGGARPAHVLCLNPALMPFQGVAGFLFPMLARILALNPLSGHFFARTARNGAAVRQLIERTGSDIDAEGLALYRRLIGDPGHVDGVLRMMARWDLAPLLRDLPRLEVPVTIALGGRDGTVPPDSTRAQAARMPSARVIDYPEHGHLMHEAAPEVFADLAVSLIAPAGEARSAPAGK